MKMTKEHYARLTKRLQETLAQADFDSIVAWYANNGVVYDPNEPLLFNLACDILNIEFDYHARELEYLNDDHKKTALKAALVKLFNYTPLPIREERTVAAWLKQTAEQQSVDDFIPKIKEVFERVGKDLIQARLDYWLKIEPENHARAYMRLRQDILISGNFWLETDLAPCGKATIRAYAEAYYGYLDKDTKNNLDKQFCLFLRDFLGIEFY
jgi:hypothetical protein